MVLALIDFTAPEFTGREIIAGAIAALFLLAGLFKAIKDIRTLGWQPFKEKWITPWKAKRKRQQFLLNKVEQMGSQICEILKEVKPNGGTSLRDEVTTIGEKVEQTAAWVHHQKETSEDPIFILDAEMNMTFMNGAFRDLVNAEEAELVYRKYLSRIEAADQKRLIDTLRVAIENKIPFDIDVYFKHEGPHFIPVRLQASVNVGHGGVLKGFWGKASKVEESPDEIHHSQI